MTDDNLVLVVGTYSASGAAADDFNALKASQDAGDFQVVGAVVLNRDASGKVDVAEHGDAHVAGGAVLGGTAGLVVGLFAPPLLPQPRSVPGSAQWSASSRRSTRRSS